MPAPEFDVSVFASAFLLTMSIEQPREPQLGDELHFHPGGQGFWIARMLTRLGAKPVLIAPLGGESGEVLRGLARVWGITLRAVDIADQSPAYVHDRRSGSRQELAHSRMPVLDRHELDDLYGSVLTHAASTGVCVVTGKQPGCTMPVDFYRRLGADLVSIGAVAVGDLHGEELEAFLGGGVLHTLKVSDDDLVEDGALPRDATVEQRIAMVRQLVNRGIERVVLSSAYAPTLLGTATAMHRATSPVLEAVDPRGSGDSMTAGLAYAVLEDLDPSQTIRLACAAGAANVTRHGLGNADGDLVRSLVDRVEVEDA